MEWNGGIRERERERERERGREREREREGERGRGRGGNSNPRNALFPLTGKSTVHHISIVPLPQLALPPSQKKVSTREREREEREKERGGEREREERERERDSQKKVATHFTHYDMAAWKMNKF
jgi:hypothetical protein